MGIWEMFESEQVPPTLESLLYLFVAVVFFFLGCWLAFILHFFFLFGEDKQGMQLETLEQRNLQQHYKQTPHCSPLIFPVNEAGRCNSVH
jgi:hypothetical protein